MMTERKRRVTGITLIVVGVLFLFVTNHILIGWEHVWPLFPIAAGVLLLRAFRSKGDPNLLFAGLLGTLLGTFLLLFSVNLLDWTAMEALWPTIPLIAGIALVAGRVAQDQRGAMVLEIGVVIFSLVAFLFTTERINPRVAAPFVRFWPLFLILAGVVLLKARHDLGAVKAPDPGMEAVRAVMDEEGEPAHTTGGDDTPAH